MFELSKDEKGPLYVDERSINGLAAIAEIGRDIVRRSYANSLDMTVDQIANIGDDEIYSTDYYEKRYELRQARRDLVPSYSVAFENGLKITTGDHREIIHALNTEPEEASCISLRMHVHERFGLSITIEPRMFWSASYNIEAGQTDVHNVEAHIKKLFKNAEPAQPFLHGSIFRSLVGISLCIVSGAICVFVMVRLMSGSMQHYKGLPFALSAVFGALSASGAMMATRKLKQAYPKVEFAFGRSNRRRAAKRAFIGWAVSVIIAPLLFLIIGLIITPAPENKDTAELGTLRASAGTTALF